MNSNLIITIILLLFHILYISKPFSVSHYNYYHISLSLSLHICKLCLTNKQVHEDYGITHKHSFPISRNDANKQVGYTFEKEQGDRK